MSIIENNRKLFLIISKIKLFGQTESGFSVFEEKNQSAIFKKQTTYL